MIKTIKCPDCGSDSIAVACYLDADGMHFSDIAWHVGEHKQSAVCNECGRTFGPDPGFMFEVHGNDIVMEYRPHDPVTKLLEVLP